MAITLVVYENTRKAGAIYILIIISSIPQLLNNSVCRLLINLIFENLISDSVQAIEPLPC